MYPFMFNNLEYNKQIDLEFLSNNPVDDIYIFPKQKNSFYGIIFIKSSIYKNGSFTFTLNLQAIYSIITFDDQILHPLISPENQINFNSSETIHSILLNLKKIFNDEKIFSTKNYINKSSVKIIKNSYLFIEEISKNIVFLSQESLKKKFNSNNNISDSKKDCISPFYLKNMKSKNQILKKMEDFLLSKK